MIARNLWPALLLAALVSCDGAAPAAVDPPPVDLAAVAPACLLGRAVDDSPSGDTGWSVSLADQPVTFDAGRTRQTIWQGGVSDSPGWLASLTFVVGADGAGPISLGIKRDGVLLVDGENPEFSPQRLLSGRDWVVGIIPVTMPGMVITGTYEVEAHRPANAGVVATKLEFRVIAKLAWRPGKQGTTNRPQLSVALIHSGPAPNAGKLACAMAAARTIWAGANVDLRLAASVALPAEDQLAGPLYIDPAMGQLSPTVGKLLRLSFHAPAETMPIFLVPDIQLSGQPAGAGIWALSGGIPIAPFPFTTQSGVVASTLLVDRDPVAAGRVLAHEIGHALGLFHTTEGPLFGGRDAIHDQLADTTACPASADVDLNGQLDRDECKDHGALNLMFWQPGDGALALTADQMAAVRRSPLIR